MNEITTQNSEEKETAGDYEIILEVLSGNINAYSELVRKYETRVRGYCLGMFSDSSQAEDAAQEIFIKAYRALGQFHGKSAFSTWIYRIAANHCTDILRKMKRQKTESWDALLEKEGEKIEAFFSAVPDPDKADRTELLAKILACLSEKDRTLLVLREIQGLSYQELSETLDCSLDAIKSRLKRVRQDLEQKFRHFLKTQDV